MSDHGFKVYKKKFYINDWLYKEGYLKTSSEGKSITGEKIESKKQKGIVKDYKKVNIGFLSKIVLKLSRYRALKNLFRKLSQRLFRYFGLVVERPKIDVENSTAYCLSHVEQGIYLNRQVVEDSEEKKKEILEKLNSIDGIEAYSREEIFVNGDSRIKLPDILVKSDGYDVEKGFRGWVTLEEEENTHHEDGFICMVGPDFQKADFKQKPDLKDIAPTVLHLFGLPVPKDMDGRVLREVLKPGSEPHSRDIRYKGESKYQPGKAVEDEKSEKEIKEKLRKLGYL